MSSVQRFPEEVLHIIFSKLNRRDIQQCQVVCRYWYYPAHVKLLQNVKLDLPIDFKRFVDSINHNPNNHYLNSIQKITLGSLYHSSCGINEISKELFELILRFPNLKSVVVHGRSLYYSEDDLPVPVKEIKLEAIVSSCTKLEKLCIFAEMDSDENYLDLLYGLRHSLTYMSINKIPPDSTEEYLAKFPQLQKIRGANGYLDSFEKFVRLIDKLPAVKDICFGHKSDVEGEAVKYLTSKSEKERDLLIEKLSKLTSLHTYQYNSPLCVNVTSFITQLLTGLTSLGLHSVNNLYWDDWENDAFCELLEYARTLQNFDIGVDDLNIEALSMCIEPTIQMMQSHQSDKVKHTHLTFDLRNDNDGYAYKGDTNLKIHMTQDCRTIKLHVHVEIYASVTPQQVKCIFESVSSLNNIEKFIFNIDRNLSNRLQSFDSIFDHAFETVTHRMLSLKEMVLDIPTVLGEQLDLGDTPVTSLALRVHGDAVKEDTVLKHYILLFPKLGNLQLFYFSGVWQANLYESQINLGFYNLQKLAVDLTPIKRKMKDYKKDSFIVVEIKLFSNSKRRLFKAPADLRDTIEINDASLEGLVIGRDYLVVRITINMLKCLDVFAHRDLLYNYYDLRESDVIQYANLFK